MDSSRACGSMQSLRWRSNDRTLHEADADRHGDAEPLVHPIVTLWRLAMAARPGRNHFDHPRVAAAEIRFRCYRQDITRCNL